VGIPRPTAIGDPRGPTGPRAGALLLRATVFPYQEEVERPVGNRNRQRGFNKAICLAALLDVRIRKLSRASPANQVTAWAGMLVQMVKAGRPSQEEGVEFVDTGAPSAALEDRDESLGNGFMLLMEDDDVPSAGSSSGSWSAECETELNRYRQEKRIPFQNMGELIAYDPLVWWESRKQAYPTLYRLAMKYLAIPATSAASERAFSAAGNIVTMRRCRLSHDVIEDLHFLHENLAFLKEKLV
jgi:hypothetical protein